MKIKTYTKAYSQFDRFVFYFGRFEITYNPKYNTPAFTCRPSHNGLYQMFEDFVNETPLNEVEINVKDKILSCGKYRIEYQGVFMY